MLRNKSNKKKLPKIKITEPTKKKKVLMGYVNGNYVPVKYHRSDAYKRKVSKTLQRNWAYRSEAYKEKMNIKNSVSNWNTKYSEEMLVRLRKKLKIQKRIKEKLFKIVPRERTHSGVMFK